jgi:SRSO17 transposase
MNMDPEMENRLDAFVECLAKALRSSTQWCGTIATLCSYLMGVLLPGERKSMEPIAERLDPLHTEAQNARIQRMITDSVWDHRVVLRATRDFALPLLSTKGGLEAWIVDDTTFPKKGTHSVGVAHQYCGNLGKTANCQDAVSVSLANHFAGLPVEYQLYLPKEWTDDPARCKVAGVPPEMTFKKKWEIAIALIDNLMREGVPKAPFLGDAAYGDVVAFRRALTEKGFQYALGINTNNTIWPPDWVPLPPAPRQRKRGRPERSWQPNPEFPAIKVDAFARSLPTEAWQEVPWREGTQGPLTSRFAAVRIRPAQERSGSGTIQRIPDEEWLLVEWPTGEEKPTKYWLSTMPADMPIAQLVDLAKLRWRIEQDYEELKQEVGLGDFEGRTWRGFHHHAALCIAAYAFLIAEQTRLSPLP